MNNENISKAPSILDRTRITLKEAIRRATFWRELLVSIPGENGGSDQISAPLIPTQRIFRAININMNDIDQLKKDHPEARSIRLYMSLPDPKYPYNICGMLVPVDENNNDMLTTSSDGESLSQEEILNSTSRSTIYDFTTPCPNLCDTQSPLFKAANSIEPYI